MTNPYAGDARRACALIVQHAQHDIPGINALLEEAVSVGRATELIFALMDMYQLLLPILHTETGLTALSQCVHAIARVENTEDPDTRRAAQIIVAHSQASLDAINAVIREIKELERVTQMILAILGLYEALCPVITTPIGVAALSKTVLDLAVKEHEDDDE